MTDSEILAQYRELTPQQRKNIKKTALQNIWDSFATNEWENPDGNVIDKLDEILKELKEMKEKNTAYDTEVKR